MFNLKKIINLSVKHIHTRTHVYIYIYIYIFNTIRFKIYREGYMKGFYSRKKEKEK